jgi:hypothetical protein
VTKKVVGVFVRFSMRRFMQVGDNEVKKAALQNKNQ